jgi:glycosyltransferase involved in cell wall biosynthesis
VDAPIDISVVLPCYNELGNVEPLLAELRNVLEGLNRSFEVIYVDDRSNDGTYELLTRLSKEIPWLRVLRHRANFGESAGMMTGFEHARGKYVFTMDADMQNDPADIPAMLARLEQGVDCVAGVRRKREDSTVKRLSSRIANKFRNAMLHDDIHDAGCTMRGLRAEALQQIIGFRAMHRFLPTILKLHGRNVEEMLINHRPRGAGSSKYGTLDRLFVGISDIKGIRWYRKRFFPPGRAEQESPRGLTS